MKRNEKLLICGLMVCALAMPAGLADGEEPAQELSQVETHTSAPAQEMEPVQTVETEQSGDGETGADPGKSPDAEESPAPSQSPDDAASPAPSQSPDAGTTGEPTADPSPEPDETPAPSQPPLPGSVEGLVHIAPEGSAQQEGSVWRIQLSAPDAQLAFTWSLDAEATRYWIYVQSDGGDLHRLAETTQARIALTAADYMNGQHTLYVGARLADDSVTWGCISFTLAGQMGGRPSGGFSGGGRPGGSANQLPAQDQEPDVTPGEALTNSHAPGEGNTVAYTCSEIAASGAPVTILRLDSTQTQITLDEGAAFQILVADGVLELIPESGGACWRLSALALRTLAESSIGRVVFHLGESAYALQTNMEFGGSIYANLCAAGYVSKDMVLRIDERGLCIEIAGNVYGVEGSGTLVPDGE